MNLTCVILAAGKGTRMKSDKAKVLHDVLFKPLLQYPVKLATELGCQKIIAVIGHQENKVRNRFSNQNIIFASQKEQLGTGHAVQCALDSLDENDEHILITCGDVPLLEMNTIHRLYDAYSDNNAVASVLTATVDDPTNYGRIVKDEGGNFLRIVEQKDADSATKMIAEINAGTYIVRRDFLESALDRVKNENAQGEYYLTDIISIAVADGEKVATHCIDDFSQIMGVNTRQHLADANKAKQHEVNKRLMLSGVTIVDPDTAYIEDGVIIEHDVTIYPDVTITGTTSIGSATTIHNGCIIRDSEIGPEVNMQPYCLVEKSAIEGSSVIGPFARLRPEAVLKKGAKVGNFVEIKKSVIGAGAKVNHLTYIGDATIGNEVNIGAGTITCNYDGIAKHKTVIEDYSFIGSNTAIVAPVTIKRGAIIGAGAVITKDVPEGTVAVERSTQRHYKRKND